MAYNRLAAEHGCPETPIQLHFATGRRWNRWYVCLFFVFLCMQLGEPWSLSIIHELWILRPATASRQPGHSSTRL